MINHISNYIETIPPDFITQDLPLKSGMYVYITLKAGGLDYESYVVKKDGELKKLVDGNLIVSTASRNFELRNFYSDLISMNKPLDKKKQIHSSSPFAIWFKKINLEKFASFLPGYLDNVKKLLSDSDIAKETFLAIQEISRNGLQELLKNDPAIKLIDDKEYVKVFFDIPLEEMKLSYEKYLEDSLFSTTDYNVKVKDEDYGLSGFLNGANPKKKFLIHRTASFQTNNRVHQKDVKNLFIFESLMKNKKIPRVFPVFIDKAELNNEVIRILSSDKGLSYREIIKKLLVNHRSDISNYYLVNWTFSNGIVINDFDYVDKFDYELKNCKIFNFMNLPNIPDTTVISNVFDFEITAVQKIFSNKLIVITKKNTVMFKYFDDLDSKYVPAVYMQNLLRFRKNFYDYVYKSKKESLSGDMIYGIIISHILYEISKDEIQNGYHTKDYQIKELINVLFSLALFFKTTNKIINNLGEKEMASLIPDFQDKLRKLFNEPDYHIQSDDEFAFDSGQLIYYMLQQSAASNKTHALIEPFISKSEPKLFKLVITRSIDTYKHAFAFGGKRFEKLAGDVLAYQPEANMKELLPVILAGYFSNSLIYEKTKNNNSIKES